MLHLYDVTGDEATCKEFKVFSPQMLIVNDRYRIHGPFSTEKVQALLEDEMTDPVEYPSRPDGRVLRGELVPLTHETALSTCDTCAGVPDPGICRGKAEWVADMTKASGLPHAGYIHIHDGKCVGGAEFLPSSLVPYPVPDKGTRDAFLTCVYRSDDEFDYKLHPMERLLRDLRDMSFETVSVVASPDGAFPNGPMPWFERLGFRDEGLLVREEMHSADLHLLKMSLRAPQV